MLRKSGRMSSRSRPANGYCESLSNFWPIWLILWSASSNRYSASQRIDQIGQKFEMLSRYPFAGRERDNILPDLRSIAVDRLLILYQINQSNDRQIIEIVRVVDGRRDLNRLFNPEDPEEETD